MSECVICRKPLKGRQRKFCSRTCKNRDTNFHHQSYLCQQERGRENKLRLIAMLGGRCVECGYNRNYSALEFHHIEPAKKEFQLDMRSLSNMKWAVIVNEVNKCRLLCANCHAEHHNPRAWLTGIEDGSSNGRRKSLVIHRLQYDDLTMRTRRKRFPVCPLFLMRLRDAIHH
jgi:hypothetical protein